MSGVAKDETTSSTKSEETVAATVGETIAGHPEISTETPLTRDHADAEAHPKPVRRAAPHLRVVADNEADLEASAEVVGGPTQRIGALIRAARENLGLELEQVSRETRIHLSHLRAIEDMTPSLLGAPVYAKGYIRNYARHLKLDPDATLNRYLSECAILADPEKQDIAPPASARKLPVAVPVLGILVVALIGGAGAFALLSDKPAATATEASSSDIAAIVTAEVAGPAVAAPPLRIVAVNRARIEVRGADGTKFLARFFSPGESYSPRVGAGWTVTTTDGAAFEWRLGDVSLGLLAAEGGPVYAQSVDIALTREPVLVEAPVVVLPSPTEANARVTVPATGVVTPPKPRAPRPQPQTQTQTAAPPVIGAPAVPMPSTSAPPPAAEVDPSLLAYPAAN